MGGAFSVIFSVGGFGWVGLELERGLKNVSLEILFFCFPREKDDISKQYVKRCPFDEMGSGLEMDERAI